MRYTLTPINSWTVVFKWEMRLQGRDGIARALYFAQMGRRLCVVRVFIKKTRKTPRAEIELALRRIAEVERDEDV